MPPFLAIEAENIWAIVAYLETEIMPSRRRLDALAAK
jgi:hypothetical protein